VDLAVDRDGGVARERLAEAGEAAVELGEEPAHVRRVDLEPLRAPGPRPERARDHDRRQDVTGAFSRLALSAEFVNNGV
jgi:hypothetical protein